jgi:ABC-2 type transport system ATP-binding protein
MEYSEFAVIADGVYKSYSSGLFVRKVTSALENVSLKIGKGEIFGLLGPNGAGKTTLLNIFSTQLVPDRGEVVLLGEKLHMMRGRKMILIRSRLNMCSGNPNFPWSLTVREILTFYAMLYGLGRKKRCEMISKYVHILDLEKYCDTTFDRLSTGTKQKLALAKSLLNEPEILFLDEPTLGLDPDVARKIRQLISDIHRERGISIILTTHYMKEAEELCGRIAFIKNGKIKAIGTSAELQMLTRSADLEEAFIELAH